MNDKEQNINDKEKYLRELRERIEEQRAENERQRAIFRDTDDPLELKQALGNMSSLDDPKLYEKARLIVSDTGQDAELRILALDKLRSGIPDDTVVHQIALSILKDQQENEDVRKSALKTLQAEEFSSPKFASSKAEYMGALRQLLEDGNSDLRGRAAEQLALDKDEFVQRKLLDEIKSGKAFLVNRAKAIQLLGHDLHAEHYPVLRNILNEEKATVTEKNEAILALANDTNSKEVLAKIATDRSVPKKLRMSGANALCSQDPYAFESVAKAIVLDKEEDNDMRVLCMNNLLQQSNLERLQDDDAFREQLRRIKGVRKSPKLKKLSREYLNKTLRGPKRGKKSN